MSAACSAQRRHRAINGFRGKSPTRPSRTNWGAASRGVSVYQLRFAGETIVGQPEADVDRTSAEGKASSVQFIHFAFTGAQIAKFRQAGTEVVLGFSHPNYGHMSMLPEPVRAALAGDFD